MLSGSEASHIESISRFLARARQIRRRFKILFEKYQLQLETRSFVAKRAAWRLRGKPSCRHGVLFAHTPPNGCKCLSASTVPEDWESARLMPSLNTELKAIVTVPFNLGTFTRLGTLQAQARRYGW